MFVLCNLFFCRLVNAKTAKLFVFLQACWLTQNWENLNKDGLLSLFKTVEQTLAFYQPTWIAAWAAVLSRKTPCQREVKQLDQCFSIFFLDEKRAQEADIRHGQLLHLSYCKLKTMKIYSTALLQILHPQKFPATW